MEWLELLKFLSQQQTNEITQQQIDALQREIQALRASQIELAVILGLMVIVAFVGLFIDHYRQGQQIKKLKLGLRRLEHNTGVLDYKISKIISKSNSIKAQNRTLGRQAG